MAEKTMPSGPGTFCWTEPMTTDTGKAGPVCAQLLGWTTEEMNMGDFVCTVFKKDGQPVAGMMKLPPGLTGVPPHWLSYVAVTSCDQATANAREPGATACKEPDDIPNMGRFSVIQDPSGAAICLLQGIG